MLSIFSFYETIMKYNLKTANRNIFDKICIFYDPYDQVLFIEAGYKKADKVLFVSYGERWIWNRVPEL